MESRIARLDEVEEPRKEWVLQFTIGAAPRSSSVVATLNEAVVRLGDFTFGPASLQVERAATGSASPAPTAPARPPCCALLLGRLAPGRRAAPRLGAERRGRRDRPGPHRAAPRTCRSATRSRRPCPTLAPADVRTLLAKFGLKADQVASPVGRLSPGERTRAAMALLQARGVNLLVLDEPTNHLDLPAIEQLEQALDSYDGALLLVSHDRRLLDNVRLDQRWHVERRPGHRASDRTSSGLPSPCTNGPERVSISGAARSSWR